jgi:nucleoside-diphosphate-sugar epimerase
MKILVTGANGYIGSKVVKTLCDYKFEVIATDVANTHIDSRARFVKADIFAANTNWFAFFGNPDVCLHMAWRDGFVHSSNRHMADLSSHFCFLSNLVDSGLGRLAVMGSMHEVGYYVGAVNELTPCNPLSQYGIAKNALRQSMMLYCKSHNCGFQWLRGFYIFGEDSFGNSVFSKIRQAVARGDKTFPLNSGGNQYDFIYIDDLAKQIALTISQDRIL